MKFMTVRYRTQNGIDYTKKKMKKFIESLTSDRAIKYLTFFNTMHELQHELEIENHKTK